MRPVLVWAYGREAEGSTKETGFIGDSFHPSYHLIHLSLLLWKEIDAEPQGLRGKPGSGVEE